MLEKDTSGLTLSLGLVDGRNVWRTDIEKVLASLEKAVAALGKDRIEVAPSCSLLHSPFDLDAETKMDAEVRSWMAFVKQKLHEVALLTRAMDGRDGIQSELAANAKLVKSRQTSSRIHTQDVEQRLAELTEAMAYRENPFVLRQQQQAEALSLPLLPTTTIGSFPQTSEVRKMRAAFRSKKIDQQTYDKFLEEETERCIRFQEEVGLDVLVHGEFERNDMVEYFGEQLDGFVFSENGWVQSYGSRCVKPPIIFGDVSRPRPMTVRWAKYAQSLSDHPVKGMLTGPVTILQWSFVRDDQPRSQTCRQIALAIRDEVVDLETAGIKVIQIDEPAIREGLPLRRADWPELLKKHDGDHGWVKRNDIALHSFRPGSRIPAPSRVSRHTCIEKMDIQRRIPHKHSLLHQLGIEALRGNAVTIENHGVGIFERKLLRHEWKCECQSAEDNTENSFE